MPSQRTSRSSILQIETLERRECPALMPWQAGSFDGPLGGLPSGWSQWSSISEAAFAISPTRPLNGAGALDMTAILSTQSARAWLDEAMPADVQVSGSVFIDTLIPGQILARGRNLNTATPSYYALSVTRGLEAKLVRVVDGVTTTLGQVQSTSWISRRWVVATLDVNGSRIRGRIYRPDTGQYLDARGRWQSSPTWAFETSDNALSGSGQAGIGRPGSYTGTVTFDDFSVGVDLPSAESFDTTPVGTLPTNWTSWSNASDSLAAVSNVRSLSSPQSLALTAPSSTTAVRTWVDGATLTDVEATASIFVDSLAPGQVLARGRNLDTATPSYYAVSVSRGMEAQVIRVQDGITTTLGKVSSKEWTTDLWVRVTLFVNGTNVRAQLFRPDRSQYLSNTGRWQETPTWAINLTDEGLSGTGLMGIARPASYVGTLSFDDFRVRPAVGDSQAPTVSLTSPLPDAALNGVVTVQATAADNRGVVLAEFYVDGALRGTSTASPPYAWELDTRVLPNGPHALDVIVYDAAGNVARTTTLVTSLNDQSITDPIIPRHYSHIRIAQLAYRGNPLGQAEAEQLRNSVDLVIADPELLAGLQTLAPSTPRLVYTNVSNLYLNRLTDWLTYADTLGVSREAAFYHVGKATPFGGDSPSSQPVTWFWGVHRSASGRWFDQTTEARGRTTRSVAFGDVGESLVVGFPERFREINLSLLRAPGRGWGAVLEYTTQVDGNGNPTAWAPLKVLSDGTFGMQFSGQLTFDPPADWKAAAINGTSRLFHVRWRTTGAGTAPAARSILGRDYVNARGTRSGVIPAFDTAADLNRDGYLNAAEYARRAVGKDARFAYESRAFHGFYGQMRFSANPSDPSFRVWAVDYHRRLLNAQSLADGFFMDNSEARSQVPTTVIETVDAFAEDYASLLNTLGRELAPKWIIANTAGGGTVADPVVRQTTASYEEFLIRPLAHNYRQFEEIAAQVARRLALRSPAPYQILDSHPTGGSPTDGRTQLATLAYYYLVGDPDRTFLNFYGGYDPASTWTRHWTPAAGYDVGRPTGAWSLFASGVDPTDSTFSHRVYGRNYANALVLYKPLSASQYNTGRTGDVTATTHGLDGAYRPLQADGTLGAAVTSITLRNGEGAILVRS